MEVRLNEQYGRSRNDMLRQRPLQFQKTRGNHLLWTEVEYINSDTIIIKRKVKEAIHMRLLQHKLDIGIDIPKI